MHSKSSAKWLHIALIVLVGAALTVISYFAEMQLISVIYGPHRR